MISFYKIKVEKHRGILLYNNKTNITCQVTLYILLPSFILMKVVITIQIGLMKCDNLTAEMLFAYMHHRKGLLLS